MNYNIKSRTKMLIQKMLNQITIFIFMTEPISDSDSIL